MLRNLPSTNTYGHDIYKHVYGDLHVSYIHSKRCIASLTFRQINIRTNISTRTCLGMHNQCFIQWNFHCNNTMGIICCMRVSVPLRITCHLIPKARFNGLTPLKRRSLMSRSSSSSCPSPIGPSSPLYPCPDSPFLRLWRECAALIRTARLSGHVTIGVMRFAGSFGGSFWRIGE